MGLSHISQHPRSISCVALQDIKSLDGGNYDNIFPSIPNFVELKKDLLTVEYHIWQVSKCVIYTYDLKDTTGTLYMLPQVSKLMSYHIE